MVERIVLSGWEGLRVKSNKIAILGATSHIAKGLIMNFLTQGVQSLDLYTRSAKKVGTFLESIGKMGRPEIQIRPNYLELEKNNYQVIINCVGVGILDKPGSDYTTWFTVTETFDNLAIEYLRKMNPDTHYISLSSGVAYGRECAAPAGHNSLNCLRVNDLTSKDYYMIARLNAETKHRAFDSLRIVDLRIFNYFSRYIELTDRYFITDVLNSILNNKQLLTGEINMVRDYVHPDDLFSLVTKSMELENINTAFDVMSAKPANKMEILNLFAKEYGLNYAIRNSAKITSATGSKNIYYSEYNKAAQIGFHPRFNSLDTLRAEAKYILNNY